MFDFDLNNGESSTGLKQTTYPVRVVDESVYVNIGTPLSFENPNVTVPTQPPLLSKSNSSASGNVQETNSLVYWAVKILGTADPSEKCRLTEETAAKWLSGEIVVVVDQEAGLVLPPDEPARDSSLNVVSPGKIRRGKGGTQSSRIALLHSLANIEQWAIDLSWDIIARFVHLKFPDGSKLPKEFFADFVKVASDEAKVYYDGKAIFLI